MGMLSRRTNNFP